jgi:branched-chain amino acid transport system permease protein
MAATPAAAPDIAPGAARGFATGAAVMAAAFALAPFVGVYPVFAMKAMCFALFACAFNLLLGFGGLPRSVTRCSGTAGYVCAHAARPGA